MKRSFKKYWGIFVPLFFAIVTLLFWGVGKMLALTLRRDPLSVLLLLNIASVVVFLLWCFLRLRARIKRKNRKHGGVWTTVYAILMIVVAVAVSYFGVMATAVGSGMEYVVERYDTKMVAHVERILDVNVHYYAYENALYYGKELGCEWYGLGLYDPIAVDEFSKPLKWEFHDLSGNLLQSGETKSLQVAPSKTTKMTHDIDTYDHAYRFIYTAPYFWGRQVDAYSPTRIGITIFNENMDLETGRIYLQNYLLNDRNEPIDKSDKDVFSALFKDFSPDTAQAYVEFLDRGFTEKAKENGWGETEIQNPVFGVVEGTNGKMFRVQFDLVRNGEKQAVLQYIRRDEPYLLTAFFSDTETRTAETDDCFWVLDSLKATKRNK